MKSEQIIKALQDYKQFFKGYALSYALKNNRGLLPPGKSKELEFTIEDAIFELERLSRYNKLLYVSNKHKSKHIEQLQKERDEARREAVDFRDTNLILRDFTWEEDRT